MRNDKITLDEILSEGYRTTVPLNYLNRLTRFQIEAQEMINRLQDLHKPIVGPADNYVCDHCTDLYGDTADFIPYPCPTIKILEGEQG